MPEELSGDELVEKHDLPEPISSMGYMPFGPFPEIPPAFPEAPPSTEADQARFYPPAWPPAPAPPMPIIPHTPPLQKRNWRGRWLAISLVVLLLLVSVASFLVIRYNNRSTPDKTLDAFCSDLQAANYQAAYDQLSIKLQQTITETAFAAIFEQDKVIACTHGTTGDIGDRVINNLKLIHASRGINNDIVTLTKDSASNWKIDDIYRSA